MKNEYEKMMHMKKVAVKNRGVAFGEGSDACCACTE
jgi:hypothetical protein